MKINNNGVTRTVFILKSIVIKIPNVTHGWRNFLKGITGNIDERDTWRWNSGKYEQGHSHLLCPIVWASWGGWIVVMKKAKTLTQEEWDNMPYYTDEHTKYFPGDDTISNYGILDDRLVKIDYADLNLWPIDYRDKNSHYKELMK